MDHRGIVQASLGSVIVPLALSVLSLSKIQNRCLGSSHSMLPGSSYQVELPVF